MSCLSFLSNSVIKEAVICLFRVITSISVLIRLDYGDGSEHDHIPVDGKRWCFVNQGNTFV